MKRTLRLAIVDDHALFREGLKDLLLQQPDFSVVAEGADGADALRIVADYKPDVLLLDLRLPKLGGISAIRRLRESHKDVKIVVISMYEDEDFKREAVLAGADAYHSKMDEAPAVIQTIRKLIQGKRVIPEDQLRIYRQYQEKHGIEEESVPRLTEMEFRILDHLSRGFTNSDLARIHGTSERTLKNHLSSIFKKLGVKTRLEAVHYGFEKKLISLVL
ncbi:MAG: response regulator transcription factor [Elusimicrobia bacterium]|nr:response regulator transcription factor [Candidatus Obscuribacterium magneticum]